MRKAMNKVKNGAVKNRTVKNRKVKSRKRIRAGAFFQSVVLLSGMVFGFSTQAKGEEIGEYELYAKAAVLMDGDSKRILYGKNQDLVLPMASTTKIMTCIVALEQGEGEETVTASAYAAAQPKVHLGMQKGEQYKLKDLLYSLMLESHNDSAVAIAEHIGGKKLNLPETEKRTAEESKEAVSAFAVLMNEKAKELGCENTYYITPNGLDAEEKVVLQGETVVKQHGTTAAELARVLCYCAWESSEREQFLEVTRQQNYSFANVSGSRRFQCTNHNAFLNQMSGALTGKTGFTNAAGYCYVGALERDGEKYVVALLACGWPNNKNWKWKDTGRLMKYGLENYELHTGGEWRYEEEKLPRLYVQGGQTEKIGEEAYAGLCLQAAPGREENFLLKEREEIRTICRVEKTWEAPLEKGEVVGKVQYFLGEELLWEEAVVSGERVEKIDFKWCFAQILTQFLIM